MKQINKREIEGFDAAVADAVAAQVAATPRHVPWTTMTPSGPDFMWDDAGNLMMTEEPR